MFVNSLTRSALLGVGLLAGSVPVLGFFPESLSHLSLFSTHQANESTDETSLALGRNVTAGRNVTGAPPLSAGAPTGFPPRTGIRKLECPAIEFRQTAENTNEGLVFTFENMNPDIPVNWVDIHYQILPGGGNVTGGNVTSAAGVSTEFRTDQINRRMVLRREQAKFGSVRDGDLGPVTSTPTAGGSQVFEYVTTTLEQGQTVRYSFTYSDTIECNTAEYTYTVPAPEIAQRPSPPPVGVPPAAPQPPPVQVERVYVQQPVTQKKPALSMPSTHRWRMVMFEDSDVPTAVTKQAAPQPATPAQPAVRHVPFHYAETATPPAPTGKQHSAGYYTPPVHYRIVRLPHRFGAAPIQGEYGAQPLSTIGTLAPTTRYRLTRVPLHRVSSYDQKIQPVGISRYRHGYPYRQFGGVQPTIPSTFRSFGEESNSEEEEFELAVVDNDINQILNSNENEWVLTADSSNLLHLSSHSIETSDVEFETNQQDTLPFTPSPNCPLIQFRQRVVPSNETIGTGQIGMGPTIEFTNLSSNRSVSFILMVFNATTDTQPQLTLRGRQVFVTKYHPFFQRFTAPRDLSTDQQNVTQSTFSFILPPLPANSILSYYFVYSSDSEQCLTDTFTHTVTPQEAGRAGQRMGMRLRLLRQGLSRLQKSRRTMEEDSEESEDSLLE